MQQFLNVFQKQIIPFFVSYLRCFVLHQIKKKNLLFMCTWKSSLKMILIVLILQSKGGWSEVLFLHFSQWNIFFSNCVAAVV